MDNNIEFQAENFKSNLLPDLDEHGVYDEYYQEDHQSDQDMRRKTTEILYNAFNHAMNFLPEMLKELNKGDAIATQYAFERHKDILLSQKSFDFFNNLLEKALLPDEYNESGESVIDEELLFLENFMNSRDQLVRVIAVCAIGYSWEHEYRQMKYKGIDSKTKVTRRLEALEKQSQLYNDEEMLMKHYKIVSPGEHKQMKDTLFFPALNEILHDAKHKNKIIEELKKRIFTP